MFILKLFAHEVALMKDMFERNGREPVFSEHKVKRKKSEKRLGISHGFV